MKLNMVKAELKQAYHLVTEDLQQQFLKMKDGQSLRLNKLGKFIKREIQAKSGLDGQTYVYYRISFLPFRSFKDTLNQTLESKYEHQ